MDNIPREMTDKFINRLDFPGCLNFNINNNKPASPVNNTINAVNIRSLYSENPAPFNPYLKWYITDSLIPFAVK